MCFFAVIQIGGKEKTTEESGFSPQILSQPIWMPTQSQVCFLFIYSVTVQLPNRNTNTHIPPMCLYLPFSFWLSAPLPDLPEQFLIASLFLIAFTSSTVAYVEKSATPEETSLEIKAEPEPVYIDEVTRFLMNMDLSAHAAS